MSILGKLNYDNEAWQKQGGVFGVQLLDSLLHQTLILATHSAVYYAGGFDACHFLRAPATKELYVHFTLDKYRLQIGRKKKVGDFALYDGTGKLCLYMQVRERVVAWMGAGVGLFGWVVDGWMCIYVCVVLPDLVTHLPRPFTITPPPTDQQGFFTVFASFTDNYKLCDLLWQPFNMPEVPAEKALTAAAKEALQGPEAWTSADNEKLTAWLVEQLRLKGALEAPAKPAEDEKKGACVCGLTDF
jgi:hypothetical protein